MKRLIFSLFSSLSTALLLACGGETAASTASAAQSSRAAPSRHLIIAVDRSGSITEQQRADSRRFVTQLTDSIRHGDAVTMLSVMQEGTDSVSEWRSALPDLKRDGAPSPAERRRLESAHRTAQSVVRALTDSAGSGAIRSTDLFRTIARFANYVGSADNRTPVIVFLSDMLHYSSLASFERLDRVPSLEWINQRKEQGLVPDLHGACIVVVGAEVATPRGVAVRKFWQRFFEQANATLLSENYRETMEAGSISC